MNGIMSRQFSYLCFVLFVSSVVGTEVKQCKNGAPLFTDVRIKDCDVPPCVVRRGGTSEMDGDFIATQPGSNMTAKALATVLGTVTDFPLPDPDVCHSLMKGECPVEVGQELTYHLSLPIEKLYPKVYVDLELSVRDENDDMEACFRVKLKVI